MNDVTFFHNRVKVLKSSCGILALSVKIKFMKTVGIIILAAGLLITIYTGFSFITKKKVADIGTLEITRDKKHTLAWSPLIGVAAMVVGGVVLLYTAKKK